MSDESQQELSDEAQALEHQAQYGNEVDWQAQAAIWQSRAEGYLQENATLKTELAQAKADSLKHFTANCGLSPMECEENYLLIQGQDAQIDRLKAELDKAAHHAKWLASENSILHMSVDNLDNELRELKFETSATSNAALAPKSDAAKEGK